MFPADQLRLFMTISITELDEQGMRKSTKGDYYCDYCINAQNIYIYPKCIIV